MGVPEFPYRRIRYYGQQVVLQDCIQRMRFFAQYVGVMDVDEIFLSLHPEFNALQLIRFPPASLIGRRP